MFFLCSHCDRGHRYCSATCSNSARREQRGAPISAISAAPKGGSIIAIRSLAYFLLVIEELKGEPLPDGYLEYLRLKLRRLPA